MQDEIKRVMDLKGDKYGNKGHRVVDSRNNRIFEEDILSPGRIKGIAKAKQVKLA